MAKHPNPPVNAAALAATLTQRCGLSIEWSGLVPIPGRNPDVSTAKAAISAALSPADDFVIVAELARLSTMVARRAGSDNDADVALAAYGEALREYPADIAVETLRAWPSRSQWWPTWFELQEIMLPRRQERQALLASLETIERTLATPRIAPDPDAEKRAAEAEAAERAEVASGLRALVINLADARKAEAKPNALRKRFRGE